MSGNNNATCTDNVELNFVLHERDLVAKNPKVLVVQYLLSRHYFVPLTLQSTTPTTGIYCIIIFCIDVFVIFFFVKSSELPTKFIGHRLHNILI